MRCLLWVLLPQTSLVSLFLMASANKPTTTTPGKGVFLAFALHLYAWFAISVFCLVINIVFPPFIFFPWSLFPILGWAIALAAHGGVTYFVVDHAGGDFSALLDEFVISKIPAGVTASLKGLTKKE